MSKKGQEARPQQRTIQTDGMTRRGFVMTALAAGFALAVRPVSAETIVTDTVGLIAGEIQIPTDDIRLPAYRAAPAHGRDFPVVLVVQEIFGVHEHIKDVCRRFAKLGYLAIAPELYARQGNVSTMADAKEISAKVVSKVPDAQVMADLDAAVAWASQSGLANIQRLGITGFCWGGRIVWLYAAHTPQVKAGVAWYGRLVGKPSELQPRHPLDVAASLQALCWDFMEQTIRGSRWTRSSRCARPYKRREALLRSWCIPTRHTASTPTIALAIGRTRRTMDGGACKIGSDAMERHNPVGLRAS